MFSHALFFGIASVLKLDKKICLIKASSISVDRCDFLPDRGSVTFVFYLKESSFVDGSVNDLSNGCLHLVVRVNCCLMLLEFVVGERGLRPGCSGFEEAAVTLNESLRFTRSTLDMSTVTFRRQVVKYPFGVCSPIRAVSPKFRK